MDYKQDDVLDSVTTPSGELHKRVGNFIPSNEVDLQSYYLYRPTMTFREYDQVRQQE
jgi:hypothetical protein